MFKLVVGLVVAVLLLLNLFSHIFMVVRYYGNGMEPALHDRQILLLLKTGQVEEEDIVAFYYNNKVLVRRVISVGGSTIEIGADGAVTVDGRTLEEPYVDAPSLGQCSVKFPLHIPVGHYFLMGDNRDTAMDSRLTEIGTIPEERIIGKVILSGG